MQNWRKSSFVILSCDLHLASWLLSSVYHAIYIMAVIDLLWEEYEVFNFGVSRSFLLMFIPGRNLEDCDIFKIGVS